MTNSFTVDLNPEDPTPIVAHAFYPQPNSEDADYKRQHRPCEVIVVNVSASNIYFGDAGAYYSNAGIPLTPGVGVTLSLGAGDELFGWADDSVTIPVMILDGKG